MLTETQASDALADLADELSQPCWRDLIEKDDRTSPEEYPDHALISQDELIEYIKVSLDMAMDPKALPRLLWRPIETAPRDGTTVDCWVGTTRLENCFFGKPYHECLSEYCDSCPDDLEVECWRWSFGNEPIHPTHWMPLPAAPVI